MCKKRTATLVTDSRPRPSSSATANSSSFATNTSSSSTTAASSSSAASRSSLGSIRDSLPDRPIVYPFSEISSATNSFLSNRRLSSSSWRCSLRGRDAVVIQHRIRGGDTSALPARLTAICRNHYKSLARLLGASLAGDRIYLVYEYVPGANLADCLRNPKNPSFTPLATWISRIQIAADLAQGLEYIHRHAATVHDRIKSSSVIVTEPHFHAVICHFGAADLAGETSEAAETPGISRSGSSRMRIEGTRPYMAPEVIDGAEISQRSDVFALGVVLLELLSGEEPLKYRFDAERKAYERTWIVETAGVAFGASEEDGDAAERHGRVRRWVDRRLQDSFPVEVAERLMGVALRCVEAEPGMRPEMTWVADKVSKLLLESQIWGEKVRVPTEISVSLAPR